MESVSDGFYMDESLGAETSISFLWSFSDSAPTIKLVAPSKCAYLTNSSAPSCNDITSPDIQEDFRIITFDIPSIAMVLSLTLNYNISYFWEQLQFGFFGYEVACGNVVNHD